MLVTTFRITHLFETIYETFVCSKQQTLENVNLTSVEFAHSNELYMQLHSFEFDSYHKIVARVMNDLRRINRNLLLPHEITFTSKTY